MMPGEAAKIPSGPAPSLQEMLTQAEVLLASPAKDVDELGLIRAPFQLSSFQQVLVGWGRWQSPTQGAAHMGLCPSTGALGANPPFTGLQMIPVPPAPSLPGCHSSQ